MKLHDENNTGKVYGRGKNHSHPTRSDSKLRIFKEYLMISKSTFIYDDMEITTS